MCSKTIALMLSGLTAALTVGSATAREFEDKFGRTMVAELVSHTGTSADSVTIEKAGKEISVKLALFSEKDQAFIREWMGRTPPVLDYRFRVTTARADVKAAAGGDAGSSERIDITVTNLTRQTVRGLKVTYRVYLSDYPTSVDDLRGRFGQGGGGLEGLFGRGGRGGRGAAKVEPVVRNVEAAVPIEEELPFNHSTTIPTQPMQIHIAKNPFNGDRYKDELLGVIVRIHDPAGKLLFEHRDTKTKDFDWPTAAAAGGDFGISLEE